MTDMSTIIIMGDPGPLTTSAVIEQLDDWMLAQNHDLREIRVLLAGRPCQIKLGPALRQAAREVEEISLPQALAELDTAAPDRQIILVALMPPPLADATPHDLARTISDVVDMAAGKSVPVVNLREGMAAIIISQAPGGEPPN